MYLPIFFFSFILLKVNMKITNLFSKMKKHPINPYAAGD